MSMIGIFITYACCWWLVLFMVLPWKVKLAATPAVGQAPSAPIKPYLKQKMLITTVLAILPTILFYIVVGTARAEDIYHAGASDCVEYESSGDVEAREGYGAGGKQVRPATMEPANTTSVPGDVYVGIDVPTQDYINEDGNPDLRYSQVYAGAVRVSPDGKTEYNGQPLSQQNVNGRGCK